MLARPCLASNQGTDEPQHCCASAARLQQSTNSIQYAEDHNVQLSKPGRCAGACELHAQTTTFSTHSPMLPGQGLRFRTNTHQCLHHWPEVGGAMVKTTSATNSSSWQQSVTTNTAYHSLMGLDSTPTDAHLKLTDVFAGCAAAAACLPCNQYIILYAALGAGWQVFRHGWLCLSVLPLCG